MRKSIFFYKELTPAEVGKAKTHEVYIRLSNDFNYEEFFANTTTENGSVIDVTFNAIDVTDDQICPPIVEMRFAYFVNSNKEKRIPSLGTLFASHNVDEGDIVRLESRNINGQITYFVKFFKKGTLKINPNTIYISCPVDSQTNDSNSLPNQVIFYGAPGTGKSHEVKKMTGELDGCGNDVERENVFRTTFHPDTDYATFVGCYKPMMKETGQQRKVNGKTEEIEEISYEFVPQTFTDAYIYALKHKDTPTYLVIEEINRGNCAQIFGDLFQLLDRNASGCSEYKIKPDKDLARYLAKELYNNSVDADSIKLSLPSNLNILATMNTSDQSLFPMDSAFKRRWDWEYVAISYEEPKSSAFVIDIYGKKYGWVDFIRKVNEKIFDLTQSEDKEMGNFFIKDSIDDKMFKSKVMFYLWNEVLRDEVGNGKYFFYYKDGDEKKQFTFKNLYGDDNIAILQGFMDYLEVEEIVNE